MENTNNSDMLIVDHPVFGFPGNTIKFAIPIRKIKEESMEYIIIPEDGYGEECVQKCNTDKEKELIEHFGLSHYNILRVNNGKIENAHWTYEGVVWEEPIEIDMRFK